MSANNDDEGGYGRPPKNTRFKPGRSGNEKGRPKGTRNLKTDLASVLQTRVAIREDGELRHVSRQEAMLLTLCTKALQGDTKASSQLFSMLAKTENQDTGASQLDVVTNDDRYIVEEFLRRNSVPVKKEGES
jgi:Family of unknown function (DUF5681)